MPTARLDPFTLVLMLVIALILVGGVILALLAARRAARAAAELPRLREALIEMGAAQHRLTGGLSAINEAQAVAQSHTLKALDERLESVSSRMSDSLSTSAQRTAHSLGDLQQRLEAIDRAQRNIEKLSGDVLGLQEILSNKQARGAFGEIQLQEIVSHALPPDAYAFQAELSNKRRADCLIYLPHPPGPMAVDSKFPLEAWRRLAVAQTERDKTIAARDFKSHLVGHIRDIAERYVIPGETADSAMMFLPSEAIYAEIHASFPDVLRAGFDLKVWIVSPATFMATLLTLRAALRDVRLKSQSDAIRRELGLLVKDVERLGTRLGALEGHFGQAEKDLQEAAVSAEKIARRARRLELVEFDDKEEG